MFKPRFYSYSLTEESPKGVAQVDSVLSRSCSYKVNETILRLAHAEYERQYPGVSYEQMQQRGGLSILEVMGLLADYVERLGGRPSDS